MMATFHPSSAFGWFAGIRAKLLVFTTMLVLFMALVLSSYSAYMIRESVLEVYREDAVAVGDTLAEAVVNDLYQLNLKGLRQRLGSVRTNKAITATFILDERGQVLADGTPGNRLRGQRLDDPFVGRVLAANDWVIESGDKLLKLGRPVFMEGSGAMGRLYLQLSLTDLNRKIIVELTETLSITVGCILLGFAFAWWFAARFTHPIIELTRAADQIRTGDTTVGIPITGRDEILSLSVSLEEMLRRLRASDRELREMNLSLDQKVRERTQELQEALHVINSSIQYASSIQRSILPNPEFFKFLLPRHFVVWQPRDVVGGDGYWCRIWGMGTLLVVGDCTGHGIPGAFVALIANGALGYAMRQVRPGDMNALFSALHRNFQEVIGIDHGACCADDGLELGACYLCPGKKELVFVGARFSLFYHDPDSVITELKGEGSGIGYRSISSLPQFTEYRVDMLPERRFVLTTDGMIDQVGGKKRHSFGKKRFLALLNSYRNTPIQEVGTRLYESIVTYQGDEIRRDDITIIGFAA